MYKRKEAADHTWLFPLIAAICATIAIFLPTANFSSGGTTWDWWMWAFASLGVIGYPPLNVFVFEMDFFIPSIITTSVVIFNAVFLIVLSVSSRKKKLKTKKFVLKAVISAVLLMGIMVYYAFGMAIAFIDGVTIEGTPFPPGIPFWVVFTPSFGLILPFISAILLFVGVGLFRRNSNQKLYSVAPTTDVTTRYASPKTDVAPRYVSPKTDDTPRYYLPNSDVATKYIPASTPIGVRNFCPECGHKNPRADMNFCTKCGFKL